MVITGSIGLGHLQSGAADKRRKVGKDGRMTGVAADDGQNRLAPFSNVDLPMWLAKTLVKKNMAQVVRLFSRATRACARESCEGGQRCGSSLRFVWRRHRLDVCDVRASCRRDAPRSLRLTLSCASCLHQRGQGATASASARVQLLVECRREHPAQLCLTLLLSVLAETHTHAHARPHRSSHDRTATAFASSSTRTRTASICETSRSTTTGLEATSGRSLRGCRGKMNSAKRILKRWVYFNFNQCMSEYSTNLM